MRAAIYARVSTTDRQEVENQLIGLRRFAQSQGWEIVGEYVDHESGKSDDRKQFLRLFRDATVRRFDVVLFWALDRFSREGTLPTLKHLELLESYGVCFRSYTEPFLDSCGIFRDAVIAILSTLAKQERLRIVERVRAGMDRARQHGTRSGRPIGRPKRTFDRQQVTELRNQGVPLREIARRLGVGYGTVLRVVHGPMGLKEAAQNPIAGILGAAVDGKEDSEPPAVAHNQVFVGQEVRRRDQESLR